MSVYTRQFGNFTQQVIKTDSDGYAPPRYGGVVNAKYGSLSYTQGTAYLFTLPEGAIPIAFVTDVTEAFTGSGQNNIDIGANSTVNTFADAVSVASIAQVTTGYSALYVALTEETTVQAVYNGTTPDAGECSICCLYLMLNTS